MSLFGDHEVAEVRDHFRKLLEKNNCNNDDVLSEWAIVKSHMVPLVKNGKDVNYLDIWKKIFQNDTIKNECRNVLHIFEIMLVTPFTNAKVERVFSRMNRVKSETRNKLTRARLDVCLRVGEEGPLVNNFNPDPVIDLWFLDRVRRLNSGPHNYKRKKVENSNNIIDISELTMSDLEESDSEYDFAELNNN